jgi:hypothetical protein
MSTPTAPGGADAAPSADPAAVGPARRTLRRIAAVGLGLLALAAGVFFTLTPPDGFPLDPRSAAGDGLLGMVELLEELDVEVQVSTRTPGDTATRVFVPVDQMTSERRASLVEFAEDGGTVVVAGESPNLHGLASLSGSPVDAIGRTSRTAECGLLDGLGEVLHDQWTPLEVPEEATACFPVSEIGAWLVDVPTGDGSIVALGSARPFTNALLGEVDNAVLAATLLGPEPGDRLQIVPRGEVGEGDTPILELVPPGVLRAAWLLLAAVIAAVLWRARRLGPPVGERLPAVLPSAELARSVADLLQRAGDRSAAAARIREDVRHEVRHALRLPAATPSPRLAELVPQRSGVAERDARTVLLDAPVEHDRELTDLAVAAARLRGGLRKPAPPTPPEVEPSPKHSAEPPEGPERPRPA